MLALLSALVALAPACLAFLNATDTGSHLVLQNDRCYFAMNKSSGIMDTVTFDGVNMLGSNPPAATDAIGPYLDAYFPPKNDQYTPGSENATYTLIKGTDSSGEAYGGMVMSQANAEGVKGVTIEQYWFLRESETSLHAFSRFAYQNATSNNLGGFTQLRTLFRPYTPIYTHLSTEDDLYVPQPTPNPAVDSKYALGVATQVQDTTWYIGNRTNNDPYVKQVADYWTKYTMGAQYRDHLVHGLYADGTQTPDNTTFGVWTVMNTKDTYFGGPTYGDLTVDGIVYNYIVSNHYGDGIPNITSGFDRTFGPSLFHLNHGSVGEPLQSLRNKATALAYPGYSAQFYDDISQHVPGYVTTSNRGSWKAKICAPSCATNAIAVLSAPGYDFQDNSADPTAYQYWVNIPSSGEACIDRIKAGEYQLTIYAENVFGQYVHNTTVKIGAGRETDSGTVTWTAESHGTELWRLGTPDWSAGEYKHGYQPTDRAVQLPQYRIYWGAYNYLTDFPSGVQFHIGSSSEANDWNYAQWSVFGNTLTVPNITASTSINEWKISFDVTSQQIQAASTAYLTVQLAGATTAAGNTDTYSNATKYSNLDLGLKVNNASVDAWTIPYYHSSSCASRSGISCYHIAHTYSFPTSNLKAGATNIFTLSLPFNATGSSVGNINVMYDAIRLEVA